MKNIDYEAGSKEVEGFLSDLPPEQRILLEKLRSYIKSEFPGVTEKISWGMPIFYHRDKQLVGYSAFKKHCSLFGMGYAVMEEYKDEIKPYLGSKATLHFTSEKPLPDSLVKKIVESRMKEIDLNLMKKK